MKGSARPLNRASRGSAHTCWKGEDRSPHKSGSLFHRSAEPASFTRQLPRPHEYHSRILHLCLSVHLWLFHDSTIGEPEPRRRCSSAVTLTGQAGCLNLRQSASSADCSSRVRSSAAMAQIRWLQFLRSSLHCSPFPHSASASQRLASSNFLKSLSKEAIAMPELAACAAK